MVWCLVAFEQSATSCLVHKFFRITINSSRLPCLAQEIAVFSLWSYRIEEDCHSSLKPIAVYDLRLSSSVVGPTLRFCIQLRTNCNFGSQLVKL